MYYSTHVRVEHVVSITDLALCQYPHRAWLGRDGPLLLLSNVRLGAHNHIGLHTTCGSTSHTARSSLPLADDCRFEFHTDHNPFQHRHCSRLHRCNFHHCSRLGAHSTQMYVSEHGHGVFSVLVFTFSVSVPAQPLVFQPESCRRRRPHRVLQTWAELVWT